LAHWTITQRTIHVVIPNKPPVLGHEKQILTGTAGDTIRLAREQAGLTREQLSKAVGIPVYWLGRWERDRALPTPAEWAVLSGILKLSADIPQKSQPSYKLTTQ